MSLLERLLFHRSIPKFVRTSTTQENQHFFETIANWQNILQNEFSYYFPRTSQKDTFLRFITRSTYNLDVAAAQKSLIDPTRDFYLRGGKRIRPMVFFATLKYKNIDGNSFSKIALAIEIIHNGTLVLDDIEDKAKLRRGKETLHLSFGLDIATNVGMSLHILPLQLIFDDAKRNNLTDSQLNELVKIYYDELANVSLGQALDISWHRYGKSNLTRRQYLEMVRLKTGSLMRMSVRMGCVIGQTDERVTKALTRFAEKIGIAFQIIDDVMDIYPRDSSQFGKSYGNDITEGKMSLLILYALKELNESDAKLLTTILNAHTRNQRKIKQAIDLIDKTNAKTKSERYAQKIVQKAWTDLETAASDSENFLYLKKLSINFIERTY